MELKQIFKENVKFYRKRLKMTQVELAKKSGLSSNYIGEIERTGRKATLDIVEKIALELNVEASILLIQRDK